MISLGQEFRILKLLGMEIRHMHESSKLNITRVHTLG